MRLGQLLPGQLLMLGRALQQHGAKPDRDGEGQGWREPGGLHRCRLLLLLMDTGMASGDCGPLPSISWAEPPEGMEQQETFPVGSKVTYRCAQGFAKLPSQSDTIQCLENSQWSSLQEFCDRSCYSPPRVSFARVSEEDEMKNFYPVGITVNYVCNPGYENSTDRLPTSTCHENLTWSEVPELCRRKSCGTPANPEHGTVATADHLFGAKASVACNDGYVLTAGSPFIRCFLSGDGVAWTQLPTCQASSSIGGTTAVTNSSKPLEEKTTENRYVLPLILVPSIIGVALILTWIIRKCSEKQRGTYKPNPSNPGDEEQGQSCKEHKTDS